MARAHATIAGISVPEIHLLSPAISPPRFPISNYITGPVRLEQRSLISFHESVPASYKTLLLRICSSAKLEAHKQSLLYTCVSGISNFAFVIVSNRKMYLQCIFKQSLIQLEQK
jgi:hypothetical protein